MATKRPTTTKMKANLAMAAFVAVSALMFVLTAVGSLSHMALAADLLHQPAAIVQTLAGAPSSAAILPGE